MAKATKPLTDSDYIYWFEQAAWSLTQAVYLIQGFVPPKEKKTDAEIIDTFPIGKRLLYEINEYGSNWDDTPGSWLHNMSSDITDSWVAIMSAWLPTSLAAICNEEPDYNRFIGAFVCDEKLPLGNLVKYALRIGEKDIVDTSDDYQAVLLSAASRQNIADGDTEALERKIVSAREFVDKYPRNLHPIDEKCSKWADWVNNHSVLAVWLEKGGSDSLDEPDIAHTLARKVYADMLKIHNEYPEIYSNPAICGEGKVYKYLAKDNESSEYRINDDSRKVQDVAAKRGLGNLALRYGNPPVAVPFTKLMKAFREISGR